MEHVSFDRNIVQYYGVCMEGENAAMLVLEYMAVRLTALPLWTLSPASPPLFLLNLLHEQSISREVAVLQPGNILNGRYFHSTAVPFDALGT